MMISLVVAVVVAMLLYWLINKFAPPPFKVPLIVLDVLIFCLWLLQWGGVWRFPGR